MTSAEREAIKARADHATPGPWYYDSYSKVWCGPGDVTDDRIAQVPVQGGDTATKQGAKDAEFIAHAREDIPTLVAEVERLTAIEAHHNEHCYGGKNRITLTENLGYPVKNK